MYCKVNSGCGQTYVRLGHMKSVNVRSFMLLEDIIDPIKLLQQFKMSPKIEIIVFSYSEWLAVSFYQLFVWKRCLKIELSLLATVYMQVHVQCIT